MTQPIKEVIEGIEKNIRSILHSKDFTLDEAKMCIIDVLGVLKDMWIRFQAVFERTEEIEKIEKATKKGKKYKEEKITNLDIKNLYL